MVDLSCTIVSKKRVIAPVWDYFGLYADNKGKFMEDGLAVSRWCKSNVRVSSGNTLNLLSHLRTHHPSQYIYTNTTSTEAIAKENENSLNASSSPTNQTSIPELFTKVQKYKKTMRQ